MSDDLERRLHDAFQRGSLPAAPASLVDHVVQISREPAVGGRPRRRRAPLVLAAAAVLLVAAGTVLTIGGRPQPAPVILPPPSVTPALPVTPVPSVATSLQVELTMLPVDGVSPTRDDLDEGSAILQARIKATGIAGSVVMTPSLDRITLDLPGVAVGDPLVERLTQVGQLDFVPLGSTQVQQGDTIDLERYPPMFSGDQIKSATVGTDQNERPSVNFVLKPAGRSAFAAYTADNIGSYFAIALDGVVVSAPVIQSSISDGDVQITGGGVGGFGADEAAGIVAIMNSGTLPYPLRITSSEIIYWTGSP